MSLLTSSWVGFPGLAVGTSSSVHLQFAAAGREPPIFIFFFPPLCPASHSCRAPALAGTQCPVASPALCFLAPFSYLFALRFASKPSWAVAGGGLPVIPAHPGCGSHGVKWLHQLQCAKLSWWQSADLIFGMIPLSCGDGCLKSCLLSLLSCTGSEGTSWGNILPLVVVRNCSRLPQGAGQAGGWLGLYRMAAELVSITPSS